MTNQVIGITGKARSGKDTVANLLIEKCGFIRYSFAAPIKDSVQEMFDWNERHREGDLKETKLPVVFTFEHMADVIWKYFSEDLQASGIELKDAVSRWLFVIEQNAPMQFRHQDSTYHAILSPRQAYQWFGTEWGRDFVDQNIWLNKAKRFSEKNDRVVIPDVRFQNEAEFFQKNQKPLLLINREGVEIKDSGHSSEGGVDGVLISHKIQNDGTIDELWAKTLEIMNNLNLECRNEIDK